jgi:hypothetical protein
MLPNGPGQLAADQNFLTFVAGKMGVIGLWQEVLVLAFSSG